MRKITFIILGLLFIIPISSYALPSPLSFSFDFSVCSTIGYGRTRTGECVRMLQDFLNNYGFSFGSADGKFGSKTKSALVAFQKANGLIADGVAGKKTFNKINILKDGVVSQISCDPNDPSSIKVISPNGGETWISGQQVTVFWTSCNIPASSLLNIDLACSSGTGHTNNQFLSHGTPNDGSELFIFDNEIASYPMNTCRISVAKPAVWSGNTLVTPAISDYSDNYFTIN